jgi:uncharacterized membrane protein (DUF2068 family)
VSEKVQDRTRVLRWIAVFKLTKAAAILGSLAVVLKLVDENDPVRRAIQWALVLHVDPDNRYLLAGLAALLRLDRTHLAVLAAGAASYAGLFAIEGIGLWRARPWAEYLTAIATASFIPFEVYELARGPSVAKVLLLAVNSAIVVYLVLRARERRSASLN